MKHTSAHALLKLFQVNGLDRVFLVPGESYLGILDALVDFPDIDTVICRHEGGAGYMAVADGRLTGRPGVVLVSRGPGVSNAAIAIHTAQQDAVPLIVVVGQIPKRDLRREAFQEIDCQKMFGDIAKWVFEPTEPGQLAEAAFKAIRLATTGTPGPVVLVIPEDIQQQDAAQPEWRATPHSPALPAAPQLDEVRQRLRQARRPLIVAGGALERPGGREALRTFAHSWHIPVAVSFRRHDLYPNDDAWYAGELGLSNPPAQIEAFRRSDLILALGTRLGDVPTQGYSFPDLPRPGQHLLHCYPDDHVVGLNYAADHGLVCDPTALLEQLAQDTPAGLERDPDWAAGLRSLHTRRAAWVAGRPADGIDFNLVVRSLATHAPDDAIVCLDAGTFAAPVYRHFSWHGTQRLMAPLSGAMGYGTPAAIASALRHPGRKTICLVGDGGFLMTGNEMIAAVQRHLPILFIVSNNASYGSIRLHQERYYPGRVSGTMLANPDFQALGAAFGIRSSRIESADQVDAAIADGLRATEPRLIEVRSSLAAVLQGVRQASAD